MLPKKYRLPASQFAAVKSHGQLLQTSLFGCLVLPSSPNLPIRFGFIVSTKLSSKATIRNHTRRILREAVRSLLPRLSHGYDFLILAKHPLLTARLDQTSQVLHEILTPYFN